MDCPLEPVGKPEPILGIEEIEAPELQVRVQLEEMGLLFLIGIVIVTVSAGISSISVMRLKPREILSKMS